MIMVLETRNINKEMAIKKNPSFNQNNINSKTHVMKIKRTDFPIHMIKHSLTKTHSNIMSPILITKHRNHKKQQQQQRTSSYKQYRISKLLKRHSKPIKKPSNFCSL